MLYVTLQLTQTVKPTKLFDRLIENADYFILFLSLKLYAYNNKS